LVATHTGHGENWNSKEADECYVGIMEIRKYLHFEG